MSARTAVLFAGLVACCTSSPRPMQDTDPNPGTAANGRGSDATPTDVKEPPPVPSAQITFVSRRREHPPISTIKVDVSLQNPGTEARWFLLQSAAGKGHGPIATNAFAVTTWALVGSGNVVLAEVVSADSFYAIQLPPGADVTLRSLKVRLAGELPANPMPLELIVADSFTIGGDVPAAWTKGPATCEPRADATQEGARRLQEKTTPDLGSVPIEVQGAQQLSVAVAVAE